MNGKELQNANPTVKDVSQLPQRAAAADPFAVLDHDLDVLDGPGSAAPAREGFDAQEVYDLLANITDPEHPLNLAQLSVVNVEDITVTDQRMPQLSRVRVDITPTIPHCSMATLIGLCIRVRLERCLPARFRIEVRVKEGSHQSETQVNKQLNDKERVAAACENEQLVGVLSTMMQSCA